MIDAPGAGVPASRHRQQRLDLLDRSRLRQIGEDAAQVRVRLDAVGLGSLDQAVEVCTGMGPGSSLAHNLIGTALLLKGEPEAALESFTREEGYEGAFRVLGQALALYALGRQEEHQAKLNELTERWRDQWPSWVAQVYAYRGDTDRAFEWLQKSVDEEEKGGFRPAEPLLQPLHNDPRWLPLLESIGKTPGRWDSVEFEVKLPAQ